MFEPIFYWTGDFEKDAELINGPHIEAEGEQENRISDTIAVMDMLSHFTHFTINDALNVQNQLLSRNNWKGIVPGFRTHNVTFEYTPDFSKVEKLSNLLFPVFVNNDRLLLQWYKALQTIHPLSDLNGRTFGIIVSILYKRYLNYIK